MLQNCSMTFSGIPLLHHHTHLCRHIGEHRRQDAIGSDAPSNIGCVAVAGEISSRHEENKWKTTMEVMRKCMKIDGYYMEIYDNVYIYIYM